MTIALGILANDGFVIAADRQETIPGYWKNDVSKLSSISTSSPNKWRCCLVSGAGDAHYIDAFRDRLADRFSLSQTLKQTAAAFSTLLGEFYNQHVLPFAAYPAGERPDFQILTAFSSQRHDPNNPRGVILLTSEHSVFRAHSHYAAVGSGSMLANSLLARFCKYGEFDTKEALLAATYVMSHVKDSIDGCGKDTDIAGMYKGHMFNLNHLQTAALEKGIRDYMDLAEPAALERLRRTVHPAIGRGAIEAKLAEAKGILKKIYL